MYDKAKIIEQALKAIEDEECVTIDEVAICLPISLRTFYDWGLHELQDIKDAINLQKVKVKKGLRRNWRKSDNPTLQIAEYKLSATDEELEKLTVSKVKQDTKMTFENLPKVTLIDAGDTGSENKDI